MASDNKRKHGSIEDHPILQSPFQHNMASFAKVRKIGRADVLSKGKRTTDQRLPTPPPVMAQKKTTMAKSRKRARDVEEEGSDSRSTATASQSDDTHPTNPTAESTRPSRSKRTKVAQPTSPQGTPSKKAAALFDRLELNAATKPIPFALNASTSAYNTPPFTPDSIENVTPLWPKELDDLVHLDAAFLSALSLYYAHNGSSSSVDVKMLLPMIATNWKKRAVSLDDLRTILAIGEPGAADFILQDYGRAGIHMAKEEPRGRALKRATSYVDEVTLKSRFYDSLRKRYNKWLASATQENRDISVFIDQLPLAEITLHPSVEGASIVTARGHQRLASLKASQAAAKAESIHPSKLVAEAKSSSPPQSRGTSLLDRILAKQALTSSLPAGPTKAQLERKAALHRIEEIARVFALLAAAKPRCSFGMQAIVQQLQQSLRNPISKEEAQLCLTLMANEIVPSFVNVMRNGNVTCVVIIKGGNIGLDELRKRVEGALATC